LSAVGLATALGPHADYGGVADGPLSVGEIIHKTRLVVDEEGSEGAAATAVVMETTARPEPPSDRFTFLANRPFWLLLRERTTGAPLFIGYVATPQG
jgi:serpin B